jgi:hypothetical protein
MLKICIKLPIKYYLVKVDYIVLLWPKERMKNVIVGYTFIHAFMIESMSFFTYKMSCTGNHKTQTLWSSLLIEAYSKANDDQLYNTNSQRTSNLLSNVFKCFMLISLLKKHESLTYTRTLPEVKVELKCLNWNC